MAFQPRNIEDVNSNEEDGEAKLMSLFYSLKKAMAYLGISENKAANHKFIFPFEAQKELIMAKLPKDLVVKYKLQSKYTEAPKNRLELHQQLKSIEYEWKSVRRSSRKTNKQSLFDKEVDLYGEEHANGY